MVSMVNSHLLGLLLYIVFAGGGHMGVVNLQMEQGGDARAQSQPSDSSSLCSCGWVRPDDGTLVGHGADVNATGSNRSPPLH